MTKTCSSCEKAADCGCGFVCCSQANLLKDKPTDFQGDYYLSMKPYFYFRAHKSALCADYRSSLEDIRITSRLV